MVRSRSTQDNIRLSFIIIFTICVDLMAFLVSTGSPFAPLRWVFGLVFSCFLPGYCLVWALFPTREFNVVETTALSIGISLALISIVALAVNFVVGNITEIPVVVSLSILTVAEAIVAFLK